MPAVKNSRVKGEIAGVHGSGRTEGSVVPGFAIRNSEGRTARFSLVIVPSKKHGGKGVPVTEQYHAFATSPEYGQTLQYLEELPPEYRSRWGIETGYRQIEGARARTTGTDPDVRMLLFHL